MSELGPILIAVAPNGARLRRGDHPATPLTVEAIAETAVLCAEAGAAMLHLHIREADGAHWLDADGYRAAETAVREAVGERLLIQFTTEAAGRYRTAQQMALVRTMRPAFVSIGVREMFTGDLPDAEVQAFYAWCRREEIAIQHILYSEADITRLVGLCADGVLETEEVRALFVLGSYAGGHSAPIDLMPFLAAAPPAWSWMTCAFGPRERDCLAASALMGGHVRAGFENNRQLPSGEIAPHNGATVQAVADALAALDRPLMNAEAARRLMGVSRR